MVSSIELRSNKTYAASMLRGYVKEAIISAIEGKPEQLQLAGTSLCRQGKDVTQNRIRQRLERSIARSVVSLILQYV
jgi:hypothetical protein